MNAPYTIHRIIILMVLPFILLLSGCNDDDNGSRSPLSQLPPATQTGAGTFGCLVNGEAIVHNDWSMNCFYQLVDGEYQFGVSGKNNSKNPFSIGLGTYNRTIEEGETLILSEMVNGNAWGGCFFSTSSTDGIFSSTTTLYSGELHITKLDFVNFIVSGTFWFDVQHPVTGERVQVREGRFDARFFN